MTKVSYLRSRMKTEYKRRRLNKAAALGEALLKEQFSHAPGLGLSNDMFNLGLIYDEQNRLEKAASLYTESLHHLKGTDYAGLASRSANLAGVFARMGIFELALHFYIQAREISKRHLGEEHPIYADTLYNLANLIADTDQDEAAISLHEEALAIREKSGLPDDVLSSLHSLASLHGEAGDYKKALEYYSKALDKASSNEMISTIITQSP